MSTPIYTRKLFKLGAILIAIGVFTYFISVFQLDKLETLYPDFGKDEAQLMLEKMNAPDDAPKEEKELSDEEAAKHNTALMSHNLYSIYLYASPVFVGLGFLFMGLSFKEPQLPELDEEEEEEGEEQKEKNA